MSKLNYVREHDTSLTVWYETNYTEADVKATRDAVVRHLRARGFKIGLDQRILRDHPIIKDLFHEGRLGNLKVRVDLAGRTVKVEFWQDLVFENSHGGRYDFDKRERMPYLIGKRYEVERNRLLDLLAGRGLEIHRQKPRLAGMGFVSQKRAECWHWNGGKLLEDIAPYNSEMLDGSHVRDGDTVYFADYGTGYRIARGVARYNINNMWWVVLPCGRVTNKGSFELYRREALPADLKGRRVSQRHATKQVERLKDAAVKAEQYERAAVLRDVLRQREAA